MAIDPELESIVALVPQGDFSDVPAVRATVNELLASFASDIPGIDTLEIDDLLIPGPPDAPDVKVRVYRPKGLQEPTAGVLYIHGGGFIFGSIDTEHAGAAAIARDLGVVVVSVEYRLAPEDPYPAGLEDCYFALVWLADMAEQFGVDPERVAVVGASAGGGLAAGLTLLTRDRQGPPVCFQLLGIPELDDRLETPSMVAFVDTPMWNRPAAIQSWIHYLGEGPADGERPDVPIYAAPARATVEQLTGLPPTYISTAELDPLRDEGIHYALSLLEAGVSVELHQFPGTFHGSMMVTTTAISRRMGAEFNTVLARALGVTVGAFMTLASGPLVYDPYAYEIHEDPYPTYARLRSEARCYYNPERDFWALSRHDDVLQAFGDSDRFSNSEGVSIDPAGKGRAARDTASFLAMDPPEHGRMRGLVSRGFTPRRVAAMEDHIRQITLEHLLPALEQESFDFVSDLAGLVPMDVVSEMLGVPKADRAELRRKADLVLHREEGVTDIPAAGIEAALALAVYYQAIIDERKLQPGDDLVSALLTAELDGDRLSDHEIASFMFLMVIAGNETTTKLLAHCWYWAAKNPREQEKVLADIERTPDWVEETLRYDTSSQLLARVTTRDLELFGQRIPAGGRVALLAGSANRDGDFFGDPDRYNLDRDTTGIVSFGFGRHFCLGASLARLETRVVLEELLKRVSTWDIDEANARRVHSVNVRGFDRLPTTVTLR